MVACFHLLVKNSVDGYTIILNTKVNSVALDIAPAVSKSDFTAVLCLERRFRESLAGFFNLLNIKNGLVRALLLCSVIENVVQIILFGRRQAAFSHVSGITRLCAFALQKRFEIEDLWWAAQFAFDQCLPHRLEMRLALLFATDQVSNELAVVCKTPRLNLRVDPMLLLVGDCDGFAYCCHVE